MVATKKKGGLRTVGEVADDPLDPYEVVVLLGGRKGLQALVEEPLHPGADHTTS